MIEGKFLGIDDLGPLGRLAAKGELVILDPPDLPMVEVEQKWISEKYQEAERYSRKFRERLKTAHLGDRYDWVREMFLAWEIEAAKLAVCAGWLRQVLAKLNAGEQMAMNVPQAFSYDGYGPIRELTQQILAATDRDIFDGARFRVP